MKGSEASEPGRDRPAGRQSDGNQMEVVETERPWPLKSLHKGVVGAPYMTEESESKNKPTISITAI